MGRLCWDCVIRDCVRDTWEESQRRRCCDDGNRDWSDALWKCRREPQAKEFRQELETEKGKEIDSSLKDSEKSQHYQHLNFNLVKLILDFWLSEL